MRRTNFHRVRNISSARYLMLAATVGLLIGVPSSVRAHPSTPEAIAPAASCTLAPLTLPLFGGSPPAILLATPPPVGSAILATVGPDAETSVRASVAEIVACLNTGKPKQVYAVFTQGYLARTYGNPAIAYLPAFERSLDRAGAPPKAPYVVQGFVIDGQTADGRVVVSITLAAGVEVWADRLVLAQEEGHWLIDEILT